MAERRLDRWLRPRYVFPLLALLATVVIFAPGTPEEAAGRSLSTRGTGPYAARAISQVLARLGWRVSERITAFRHGVDASTVYVILDPAIEPSRTEVSVVLRAVRGGARLLVSPRSDSPLADSIGIRRSSIVGDGLEYREDNVDADLRADTGATEPPGAFDRLFAPDDARHYVRYLRGVPRNDRDTLSRFPTDTLTLLTARTLHTRRAITAADSTLPVIMARRMGAGVVMVVADPGFFRNAVVRDRGGALLAVRLFEWLDSTHTRPIVFDEYHNGYGVHVGSMDVVVDALVNTPWGRAIVQLVIAALLLLILAGVRAIAPVPRARIERRSPLEHVGALSRAYEQIGATRLATRRLVRGLRRRHPLGATGGLTDERWLDLVRARVPALAPDVETLQTALAAPLAAQGLVQVGAAIHSIERTIVQ